MADLYRVLGVTRTAEEEQIKRAFRRLAKKCHPDLNGGDRLAAERFKEVRSAYETLRCRERRASYDMACAEARALARRRLRQAVAAMAASFALTLSTGSLVGILLARAGVL
jgi:curved DNA-binding protein CbpA